MQIVVSLTGRYNELREGNVWSIGPMRNQLVLGTEHPMEALLYHCLITLS